MRCVSKNLFPFSKFPNIIRYSLWKSYDDTKRITIIDYRLVRSLSLCTNPLEKENEKIGKALPFDESTCIPKITNICDPESELIVKTIYIKSIEELKRYLDNSSVDLLQLKVCEYIYLLFKIYEIAFSTFYLQYEQSEICELNNPSLTFVSFYQYVQEYAKKRKSEKVVVLKKNEVFFDLNHKQYEINGARQKVLNTNSSDYEEEKGTNEFLEIYFTYVAYLNKWYVRREDWTKFMNSFFTSWTHNLYKQLLQIMYKKSNHLSSEELINYFYITKRMNIGMKRKVCISVEPFLIQHLKFLKEEYLLRLADVVLNTTNEKKKKKYVNSGTNRRFIEAFLHFLLMKMPNMNNENMIRILEYVNNNKYKHIQFFKDCTQEVFKRYYHMNEEHVMKVFYLYGQNKNASNEALLFQLFESLQRILQEKYEDKIDQKITEKSVFKNYKESVNTKLNIPLYVMLNVIWVNGKHFKHNPILLQILENTIMKYVDLFNGGTISMLTWTYSSVEQKSGTILFTNSLYEKLKERALTLYKYMSPKELSNCLLGFAITLGRIINKEGYVQVQFHEIIERYILEKEEKDPLKQNESVEGSPISFLNYFSSDDLAITCYAYSVIRSGSKQFHAILQNALITKVKYLSSFYIARVVYTYGNLCTHSSYTLMSSLQYEILQRLHQFRYHELSDIIWSYCVNKFYDSKFLKTLLYAIDFEKIYKDARCCLLYSCLSFVNLKDSTILESYNVLRIFHFLREHYWNLQIQEYPHIFAQEVIQILEKENEDTDINPFECIHKMFDFEGFLIDIYFEHKKQKYALFLYTPLNTTSDGNPLGDNVLKNRYLKRNDFKTIHLLYSLWKNCKKEKRKDLIYAQL